jgi:hypothetical protein
MTLRTVALAALLLVPTLALAGAEDDDKLCEVIGEAPNISVPPKDRLGLASAASAEEPTVLPFDAALSGFVGPQYAHPGTESGPTGTILLGGGQASVRFGPVSLGLRVGWTTEVPIPAGSFSTPYSYRRIEGIVGFDIGLSNDRTVLRPYLGGGQSAKVMSGVTSTAPAATAGLELDHYLTRFLSIGGGVGLDTHIAGYDGIGVSWGLSAVARISIHWQSQL